MSKVEKTALLIANLSVFSDGLLLEAAN